MNGREPRLRTLHMNQGAESLSERAAAAAVTGFAPMLDNIAMMAEQTMQPSMVQKLIRSVVAVLRDRYVILASGIVASSCRSSFGE